MKVDYTTYKLHHGKNPGGVGNWSFSLSVSGKVQQIVTFRDLEYSKAERKARELVARSPSPKSFTIIVLAHQQTPEVIRA